MGDRRGRGLAAGRSGRGCQGRPGMPDCRAARAAGLGGCRTDPLSDVLARRLMEQRVVLLHGPLDDGPSPGSRPS